MREALGSNMAGGAPLLRIDIDSARLGAAADAFVELVRLDAGARFKSRVAVAVEDLAQVTAPGSWEVYGSRALARGRQAVTKNTLRVVYASDHAPSGPSVAALVKSHWRGRKTRRPAGGDRFPVPRAELERYLRETWPKVGYTAGGWTVAAGALGAELPSWITDRPGPGAYEFSEDAGGVRILAENRVAWLPELRVAAMYARIFADMDRALVDDLQAAFAHPF